MRTQRWSPWLPFGSSVSWTPSWEDTWWPSFPVILDKIREALWTSPKKTAQIGFPVCSQVIHVKEWAKGVFCPVRGREIPR